MKCVKCGQEIENNQICPFCGSNQVTNIETTSQIIQDNASSSIEEPVEQINEEKNKKQTAIFNTLSAVIIISILAISGYMLIQYLNPKIEINHIEKEYEYSEITAEKFSAKGSLFVKAKDTEWSINGYKFAKGSKVTNIPVTVGENLLTVSNGNASNTYRFIVNNDTSIIVDGNYAISIDYLDFDQDGLSNSVEKEQGTSPNSNDTDGDGLYDNVELIMLLDPLQHNSYNEIRQYKVIQDNDKSSKNYLLVKSKGNVANTFLDTIDLSIGFSSTFIQSEPLKVSTTNTEVPESMYIYFDKETNWNVSEYSIYMFDENTGNLQELKTEIGEDCLVAPIIDFDKVYFVGKKANVPKKYLNQIIILIDNSGSMFPKDYVTSNKNANDAAYYHDPEFKRLSLMNSLVDELGTENYEYSVYAFTATYCDVIKYSSNAKEIKNKINSLKTECQKFNGTDMSGAIKEFSNAFKNDVYGAKYMIVLTDGKDTGNNEFNLSDYYLNNYRKQGIHIITLGLSSDVNSDYLMNIAYLTNGKYLFASDANMLDTLAEIIKSSINKATKTTKFNDKDYILLADSGFKVDRDGFSFKNFTSLDSPVSNSYGFSYLAKQIYLNKVYNEEGKSDIVKSKMTSENKKRLIKGNIYEIKLTDEYNKLVYEGNTAIDLNNSQNKDDDYQLLQIINQAYKVQYNKNMTKINDYVLKHFQHQFYNYDADFNKLITELQSGSPAILTLSSSAGSHSVLANKIYKSVNNDEYVISVYDSNIPGREGYIYLKRSTAYYKHANSTYYIIDYNEYDIEFNNMLYLSEY